MSVVYKTENDTSRHDAQAQLKIIHIDTTPKESSYDIKIKIKKIYLTNVKTYLHKK